MVEVLARGTERPQLGAVREAVRRNLGFRLLAEGLY